MSRDPWKLKVFEQADELVVQVYLATRSLPVEERFGLQAQIRRAAVSIPANIAEGYGRDQTGSFVQFLRIAQGSARELETHLILTERIRLAEQQTVAPLQECCERISKMLRSLIRSLEARRAANQ